MDPQSQLDKEAEEAEKRENALQFLESMEQRHEAVLDELDALEERIEGVLAEYLGDRYEPLEGRTKRRRKGKTSSLEATRLAGDEPAAERTDAAAEIESDSVESEPDKFDEELAEELAESAEEVAEEPGSKKHEHEHEHEQEQEQEQEQDGRSDLAA